MRAAVLRDGRLEVRETEDPVPGPGELLLRTVSTAICASDVHYMDHPRPESSGLFAWDAERDVVMGHEFVGEVVAYGPSCSGTFPLGSRVTAMPALIRDAQVQVIGAHPDATGSFGELFVVSESLARPVPPDADPDRVALCDVFAVGEGYVSLSQLGTDELPLVIGAGAVGLSTVAALAGKGLDPILIADRHDQRRELSSQFGPTIGVNPSLRDPFELWQEVAREHQIVKPPVVFECAGVSGLLQKIVDTCPQGTRIFSSGGWFTEDTLQVNPATMRGLQIQFGGAPDGAAWYRTLDAILSGRLDPGPAIGMTVGLDRVPEAVELARRGTGPPRIIIRPTFDL